MPTILNATIELHTSGTVYVIAPNEGYALHHSVRDYTDTDDEGNEIFIRGYSRSSCSVPLNYNFDETVVIDGYTAHGRFELFARPIDDINGETDRIFGGGDNDHEVMGEKPETETE